MLSLRLIQDKYVEMPSYGRAVKDQLLTEPIEPIGFRVYNFFNI